MLKRGIVSAVIAVTLIPSLGWVVAKMTSTNEGSPLKVIVSTLPEVNYSVSHIPMRVTFENVSDKDVSLLSAFKDPELYLIFFRLNIRASDGTAIATLGGGKVALSKESYQYIVLKKGEKTDIVVEGARSLPPGTKLKEGDYDFSLLYQNQYGAGCFQGKIESNTVRIGLGK